MIKIAHEAPNTYFAKVQEVTDYDYALVHLFDQNEQYFNNFKNALHKGREVILDNSIFELGEAYEANAFRTWIEKLTPTWFIVPDVLGNAEQTIRNVQDWEHYKFPVKKIGVLQGNNLEEICWCYNEIAPLVDKVAISFDYAFFIDEEVHGKLPTKYHHYMYGRDALLHYMYYNSIIDPVKPHHLLGCGLPQEFAVYRDFNWIDSLDTSNPVVCSIKGIHYNGIEGLENKPSQKLHTMIDVGWDDDTYNLMMYNIETFRGIVNG